MHLLNPEIPLEDAKSLVPPKRRTAVAVGAKVLAGYVGRYRFPERDVLTITLAGEQVFEQVSGELKESVFAESRLAYFCKLFDEQITFKVGSQGFATALIYTQSGKARQAKRME
jgi:hypothetical protein